MEIVVLGAMLTEEATRSRICEINAPINFFHAVHDPPSPRHLQAQMQAARLFASPAKQHSARMLLSPPNDNGSRGYPVKKEHPLAARENCTGMAENTTSQHNRISPLELALLWAILVSKFQDAKITAATCKSKIKGSFLQLSQLASTGFLELVSCGTTL